MTRTETERLVRIETLLEEKVIAELTEMREDIRAIREKDIVDIRNELQAEQKARAALENKGKGALAVASLVFTSIGAFVTAFWDSIRAIFH